jgi:hypothetical protein
MPIWASQLDENDFGLSRIYPNDWGTLSSPLLYRYALLFAAKSKHVFGFASLASVCESLGRLLEMDPLCNGQRTLENCLSAFASDEKEMDNPIFWEAFLRRTTIAECSIIPQEQWWIHTIHPKMKISFWLFCLYFFHREPQVVTAYLTTYPQFQETMNYFDYLLDMAHSQTYHPVDHSSQSKNWFRSFFEKLVSHTINESNDDVLRRFFVRPRLNTAEKTPIIKMMNLPAVPCIMRQFTSPDAFLADVNQLQIPHFSATLTKVGLHPTSGSPSLIYALVEQTALVMELSINYYMAQTVTRPYKQQIFIYPRTTTTSYLIASPSALRVLRYCQLSDLTRQLPHSRNTDPKENKNQVTAAMKVDHPPLFPVLMRTWLECQWKGSSTLEEAIGLYHSLINIVRWCYLSNQKNLTNTWFVDEKNAALSYHSWKWVGCRKPGDQPLAFPGMVESMLPVGDPNFVSFYSNFFGLIACGWRNLADLRKAMMEAKLKQPDMDDYLNTGPCSIFAFVESFIFINAVHAIRFDNIDWLAEMVSTCPNLVQHFPPITRLVRTLCDLKKLQTEKNAHMLIIGQRETQWRQTWLVMNRSIPNVDMLIQCYYMVCLLPDWSEEQARRLLLGCRLAPRYPLEDLSQPYAYAPGEGDEASDMDISSTSYQEEREEENTLDFSDPNAVFNEILKSTIMNDKKDKKKKKKKSTNEENSGDTETDDFLDSLFQQTTKSQSSEEPSSIDICSMADDSEDNFSFSADESSDASSPGMHLKTLFQIRKKRKRQSGENVVHAKTKRQRRLSETKYPQDDMEIEKADEASEVRADATLRKNYCKWNMFTQVLSRREIATLRAPTQGAMTPPNQPLYQTQCQLEFFACLEDFIRDRNISLNPTTIIDSVTANQIFLHTFNASHHYVVYFGTDNLDKLYKIQSDRFTSFNYTGIFMEKIAKIKSLSYQQFAQNVFSKYRCRLYFDHEVLQIPSVIDRLTSHHPMQSYQRLLIEHVFEQIPRQDYHMLPPSPPETSRPTPVAPILPLNQPTTNDIDTLFMPPPPSVPKSKKTKLPNNPQETFHEFTFVLPVNTTPPPQPKSAPVKFKKFVAYTGPSDRQ